MNVNFYSTKDYENKTNWNLGKNKANTKPIRANLLDAQMNLSSVLTKDYENERLCRCGENKPNQTQFYPPILLVRNALRNDRAMIEKKLPGIDSSTIPGTRHG